MYYFKKPLKNRIMDHQTTLIASALRSLGIITLGFSLVFMFLSNIQRNIDNQRRQEYIHYAESINRLKKLSVAILTQLKESSIATEQYEAAKRLTEILEKDYKECFGSNENKPEKKKL